MKLLLVIALLLGAVSTASANSFSSSGTTTNGTSVNADPARPHINWGTLHPTAVYFNGVLQAPTTYTIVDDNTSTAFVQFFIAIPNGTAILITGDCTGGSSQSVNTGSITFS